LKQNDAKGNDFKHLQWSTKDEGKLMIATIGR